jgi:uncharacterized membrane protein YphA (DoxX/SURF4 family)
MKRILLIAGRVVLGAIMIYAAYTKLRSPWLVFAGSISQYNLVPDNWLEPMAKTLPWFELALGVLLVAGVLTRWAGLLNTLLLGTFFGVMVRSYAAGLKIDCGCFGPGEALGPKTLVRDGLLVALSAAVTIAAFRSAMKRKRRPGVPQPADENPAVHAV